MDREPLAYQGPRAGGFTPTGIPLPARDTQSRHGGGPEHGSKG